MQMQVGFVEKVVLIIIQSFVGLKWTKKETKIGLGHTEIIRSIAVSPNNQRVVSGSNDKTVKIWDSESGSLIHTLAGHTGWVNSVAVIDNQRVVSGSRDKTVKIWDSESGSLIHTLKGHTHEVTHAQNATAQNDT